MLEFCQVKVSPLQWKPLVWLANGLALICKMSCKQGVIQLNTLCSLLVKQCACSGVLEDSWLSCALCIVSVLV